MVTIEDVKSTVSQVERDDLEAMFKDIVDLASPYVGDDIVEMFSRAGKVVENGRRSKIYTSKSLDKIRLISSIVRFDKEVEIYRFYKEIIQLGFRSHKGFEIGDVLSTKEIFRELINANHEFKNIVGDRVKAKQNELNAINHILKVSGFKISRKVSNARMGERVRAWHLTKNFREYSPAQLVDKYEIEVGYRIIRRKGEERLW